MYKLTNGTTGQGHVSIVSKNGRFVNVTDLVRALNESETLDLGDDVDEFVLLNVIELNKLDYLYYTMNSNFKYDES